MPVLSPLRTLSQAQRIVSPLLRSTQAYQLHLLRSPPANGNCFSLARSSLHGNIFHRAYSTKEEESPIRGRIPAILTALNDERLHRVLHTITTTATATTSAVHSVYTRVSQTKYGRLMRLDKPVGTNLLFLPCAWGISLGATSPLDLLSLSALFYGGAVIMRGAGCTANDILDIDIDRQVERTQSRPLAAGQLSTPTAVAFLTSQLLGGLWILTRLNPETFLLGTLSVLPAMFYPLSKRRTAYPQAVLGLTFNWGAVMGYCAATGTISPSILMMYGAGWCWTMVYDTIYAHQDKRDDKALGVHSTALTFGDNTKPTLAALTGAKLALLTAAGLTADLSLPYFMGITASAIHLGHQVYNTDLDNPEQCQEAFVSNQTTGAITWLSILAGRLF